MASTKINDLPAASSVAGTDLLILDQASQTSKISVTDFVTKTGLTKTADLVGTSSTQGSSLVGFKQGGTGSVNRTVSDKLKDFVSVKDFGAVGDYTTDDTSAITLADAYAAASGKVLYFPSGQYGITDGIEKKAKFWIGDGAPEMGTFPDRQDDKKFLRPGYKTQIPGSSILLKGTGTKRGTTVRSAPYDSFTYGIKDGQGDSSSYSIIGIGIIMDMNVLDSSGNLTTTTTDARSSYDVGLFCNDVTKGRMEVTVFGYFPVAGVIHYGDDPDQTTFNNGSSSGNKGFVVLGTGSAGLSSTTLNDWKLYANDHHSRATGFDRGNCLVVDGGAQQINGFFMNGGRMQTYGLNVMKLDNVNTVIYNGVTFELPDVAADSFAADSMFIGTSTVGDVSFVNCRFTDNPIYGSDRLASQIGGVLYVIGGPTFKGIEVTKANQTTRLSSDGVDNGIQFSSNAASSTAGWKLRRRGSSSDDFQFMYANVLKMAMTTAGKVTMNGVVVQQARSTAVAPAITLHSADTSSGLFTDSANTISVGISGTKAWSWGTDFHYRPGADNVYSIGIAALRPSVIYAGTGTINTSDERLKQRMEMAENEKAAALEIKANLWKFKFVDSVDLKGEKDARIHFGVGAQGVGEILKKYNLNPDDYAFFCYDEWEEVTTPVMDVRFVDVGGETVQEEYDTGEVTVIQEKGDRYGIRYEELLCFIMAAL